MTPHGPCPTGIGRTPFQPDPTSPTGRRSQPIKCGRPVTIRKGEGRWVCEQHHPLGKEPR